MDASITERQGVAIVDLHGPNLDIHSHEEMREAFNDIAQRSGIEIVVMDMRNIQHIDSVGLGALISGRARLPNVQEIRLCGISEEVERRLRLAQFHLLFPMHNTVEQAVKGQA
jgi:anti-anti-sigma factor